MFFVCSVSGAYETMELSYYCNCIVNKPCFWPSTDRSTCSNLLECYNDWTVCIQSRQQVAIVYIDFRKAFDLVSHNKLFSRLHSYGVRGTVLSWIQNFLNGRTHQTSVGISLSDIADLVSGVVQGCGIGPLMFLVYINELAFILENYGVKIKNCLQMMSSYICRLITM